MHCALALLARESILSSSSQTAWQPLQVDQAAHANLEAVLWRDTAFLAGLGVMDYSLLVGLDSQTHRLVIGIIDFIRQVGTRL